MRNQLIGVVFVVIGVILLWKPPHYSSRRDVVEIGGLKASVEEQKSVPPWIGAVAVGVGVILLISGARRRS